MLCQTRHVFLPFLLSTEHHSSLDNLAVIGAYLEEEREGHSKKESRGDTRAFVLHAQFLGEEGQGSVQPHSIWQAALCLSHGIKLSSLFQYEGNRGGL